MVVGSAICTGAPTSAFGVLLLGRSLQGIGAAGVNISVRTILADKVSLKDYAINWTVFILISSVSLSIGPVIGGYLTEASWRWCFAINLPVGIVGMILVAILLRRELLGPQPLPEVEGQGQEISSRRSRFLARISTIDFGGQMLFLWGLGLLILAFTWAGSTYAWSSAAVLAILVIGAVLAITWLFYEYSMTPPRAMSRIFPFQRPMIPWVLLEKRDIGILFSSSFTVGISMFSVLYFMDFYFALVEGNSASKAGISRLYFLPGAGAGSFMAMYCSNVWPRQTLPALMLGAITSACGITILPWAIQNQKTKVVYGMMALAGHGIGMRMDPASLHALA